MKQRSPDSQVTPPPPSLKNSPSGEDGSRASHASQHSHVPVQQNEPSALRPTPFSWPSLRELQQAFAGAVFEDASTVLAHVRDEIFPAARHLQVYRNNTFANLTDALAAIHPVVQRLVGAEFFEHAADRYIRRHPPRSGNLHDFGEAFAEFLADFPPAQSLAYLPDVARLEWAWHEAFHAAEAAPFAFEGLGAIPPEAYEDLIFRLHPSARLLASKYPVLAIWEVNQPDFAGEPAVDLDQGGNNLLVMRRDLRVEIETLGPGEYALLGAFAALTRLADAHAIALEAEPGFELMRTLQKNIQSGAIAGFTLGQHE